jgi:hypothetical protein
MYRRSFGIFEKYSLRFLRHRNLVTMLIPKNHSSLYVIRLSLFSTFSRAEDRCAAASGLSEVSPHLRDEDYRRRKSPAALLGGCGGTGRIGRRGTRGVTEHWRRRRTGECNRVSGVGDYGGTSNIKRPGTKRRSTTPDYSRCTALSREIDTRDAF